jgi:acyl-CoA dehydrogenase
MVVRRGARRQIVRRPFTEESLSGTNPSIYFSEEHDMLRATIRRHFREDVLPIGEEWEKTGQIPREEFRRLGQLELLGLAHPESVGGAGLGVLASVILAEELGRSTFGGLGISVSVHTDMASPHLVNAGTPEQIAKYMPGILKGELITALAVTEPDAGSDVGALRTRADRKGDSWVLNGAKLFVTNGGYADVLFVAARTDQEARSSRGLSMFIVEHGTPGLLVSRKLDKHGWRCSETVELAFQDCVIPAGNLLGELNRGFYAIMRNFQRERIVLAGMAVGESARALEITMDYVKQRMTFGTSLFDKQVVRQRLAMLATKLEAGRQLLYHAAWLESQGLDCTREVSMVKAYCGELVNEVMYDAVQFHGGFGFMREATIERMSRDARVHSIGGGATEVMLEEVAKRMLKD